MIQLSGCIDKGARQAVLDLIPEAAQAPRAEASEPQKSPRIVGRICRTFAEIKESSIGSILADMYRKQVMTKRS